MLGPEINMAHACYSLRRMRLARINNGDRRAGKGGQVCLEFPGRHRLHGEDEVSMVDAVSETQDEARRWVS